MSPLCAVAPGEAYHFISVRPAGTGPHVGPQNKTLSVCSSGGKVPSVRLTPGECREASARVNPPLILPI